MSIFRRITNLFFRAKVDREIDAELKSHIEMRVEDNLVRGMSPRQARRDALVRFGNPIVTKERTIEADATLYLASIWADIRYAVRQLWRSPGFAGTAIVVLALGLAASVAIFAFVDAALIKPLPYRAPSRLVALFESNQLGPRFHLSYLDYLDWKKLNSVFSSMDAYDNMLFELKTTAGIEQAQGASVGDGFFRTLGVAPALGRDFRAGDDLLSAPRTVLLSYVAWQKRYGGRANVLGQTVTLEGFPNTIIGVLPQGFHFAPVEAAEFWTTLHHSTKEDRGEHGILAIARLKDGVSLQAASANLQSIAETLAKQYPDADTGRGATVVELPEVIIGHFRPILLVLLSGAALLLLIAYVNVASLLLVRSENRKLEIAMRGALGASPGRLARQFVTEGVLLASVGSGLGLAGASLAMQLLGKLIPADMMSSMPYLQGLGLNGRVMLFACVLSLGAAMLFSIVPMLRLRRNGVEAGLSVSGRGFAGTLWRRMGSNLVVIELATAMVLLVAAGLLGKSFYRLLHTELGMEPDHLAMLRIVTPRAIDTKDEQLALLAKTVVDRIGSLPGVQSVGVSQGLPVGEGGNSSTFEVVGRPTPASPNEEMVRSVGPGYFTTLRTRLLRGRYFQATEDATRPRVVILNQAMVKRYFPTEDPLGRRIVWDASSPQMEVVGVVEDIKEGPLDKVTRPSIYLPFAQNPNRSFYVLVRTTAEGRSLLPEMTAAIHEINPGLITLGGDTMTDRIKSSPAAYLHRCSALLVGAFAGLALVLAVVGLYGVVAYSVSRRTREIGVRMALGAQRSAVYGLVLKEAGWLTVAGIGAGGVCSVALATLMRSLLFGTQAWDAATLAGVAAMLAVFALLASFIPARGAASVNPIEALRAE
jgi:macrolide transport system ATP-binding/permease protein